MTLTSMERGLLNKIADLYEVPEGAHNLRLNAQSAGRKSTGGITITPKADKPGIDVVVKAGTKNESVHIPVLVTEPGLVDKVYNSFEIGENADVLVVAGCAIHNNGTDESRHDGIHEFVLRKGARMRYTERHFGEGSGRRVLNPKTVLRLEEGAYAELELVQIAGVDDTLRETEVWLETNAHLVMNERLLTTGQQKAESIIRVRLDGAGSSAEVLSRSVGQDRSVQLFKIDMDARHKAKGHVACDSILMDSADIQSVPALRVRHPEAEMTHEAAIGRIDDDQVVKLMSLGLTHEEAVQEILAGFLGEGA